jgi:hypothetical protein
MVSVALVAVSRRKKVSKSTVHFLIRVHKPTDPVWYNWQLAAVITLALSAPSGLRLSKSLTFGNFYNLLSRY